MATKTKPQTKKPPSKPEPKKPGKGPAKKKKPAAKAKPPERYDTPEALAKYDAATFAALSDRQAHMRETRQAFLAAKERAADLKKNYESARIEYEDALDERKKYRGQKPPGVQLELPFERSAPPAVDGGPVAPALPAASPAVFTPDAPHSDLWRQFPLERWTTYGCAPSDIQKLKEGKLKKETGSVVVSTVGELSDFTKPFNSDPTRNRQLGDIKGIGPEAATRIGDAEIRFWNEWNTKGLKEEFAREKGVNLNPEKTADADDAPDAGGGSGANGEGGKGDKPRQPASPRRRKPHAANPGSRAAKSKGKGKPAKQPDADAGEQPATVPFEQPKPEQPEPAAAAGG